MNAEDHSRYASGAARLAGMIGLAYFAIGALWILLSDRMVEAASRNADWLVMAQRYKGMVYVLGTSLGLFWLVYRGYRRLLSMQDRVARSDLRVIDLFENHPQPMWVYDLQSDRFLRVNDAAVAAYGYSRDEFLALSAPDIRPPIDAAPFAAAAWHPAADHGAPGVCRHLTKDGRVVLARISQHRVQLEGHPAMMVMAEDVTAEVGMQGAVLAQQRRFQQLHQSLGEVLWMASPDFRSMVYVSPAFETLYGRSADDLIADPRLWRDMVHPEDVAKVADLRDLAVVRDSVQCEYRIVRPDGGIRWIEDRKRLIRDETGTVVLVGGIAEDITARKERDEARDALNSKLEALVAARTCELQQANIELEAFSRTAAHDLKSPLNGIAGMSTLLRMRAGPQLDAPSLRYLELIERSSRNMASLINDLLSLSHAGAASLQCAQVDLAPMVQAQLDELKMLDPLRQVEVSLPPRLAMYCDPGLMRSVVQNLLTNAWKFTGEREDARVALTLARCGPEWVLTVSDNGAGFDASNIGALLRPFQRFHTQAQFQGTGLGLVTCQRIAHRHGGRLVVNSTPGVGTSISVVLPVEPGEGADKAAVIRRNVSTTAPALVD